MNKTELTPELLNRLESYLDESMASEERELFRRQIESDPELEKWLETLRRVNTGLASLDYYAFKDLIAHTEKEWMRNRPGLHRLGYGLYLKGPTNRIVIPAAVAACILLLSVFIWKIRNESPPERIFSYYYARYMPDEMVRSDQPAAGRLESAVITYLIQGSAASLPEFRKIVNSDSIDRMAWFYMGLAELDQGRADSAVYAFNKIPSFWESDYAPHRDWYLAMAHLRLGNMEMAGNLFSDLASRSVYYAKRAKKICRLIRS